MAEILPGLQRHQLHYSEAGDDEVKVGIIEFTGNSGETFDFIDLDFDGNIDLDDYAAFLAGYGSEPLAGLTQAQRNVLETWTNDSLYTVSDFLEFKRRFDAALGSGAFAAMLAEVPEPGSMLLMVAACGMGLIVRRRGQRGLPVLGALAIVALSATSQVQAQQVVYIEGL